MSLSDKRLLKPELIPRHLWDPEHQEGEERGLLKFPPALVLAHQNVIDQDAALRAVPHRATGDSPVGGVGDDETRVHFVQAFDGSSARCLLAFLDPKNEVIFASNRLVRSLAGNSLCFTDAPCGSGAAFASILTALAELRQHGVLPREPLDLTLVGADVSPLARDYATQVLGQIRATLEEQAIFVQPVFIPWDVLSQQSNMNLIRQITRDSHARDKALLTVANFTGFLITARQYNAAEDQLKELFRYCSMPGGAALWIEPQSGAAIRPNDGLFARIKKFFLKHLPAFGAIEIEENAPDSIAATHACFRPFSQLEGTAVARMAVLPFHLEPQPPASA